MPDSKPTIQRFGLHVRAQHIMLMVGVVTLAVTGIPLFTLRNPVAPTAASTIDLWGGLELVRFWHRLGAIVLCAASFYHLVYIALHPQGRKDFRDLLPGAQDFRDFYRNLLYFLGRRREPPRFGRFSYFEKFDYWAAFWGCVIMIGTGLVLWRSDLILPILPAALRASGFETALEAHGDEAILASVTLFTWHIYNVHLKPGRFPGSLVWLHGKISEAELRSHHPRQWEEGAKASE